MRELHRLRLNQPMRNLVDTTSFGIQKLVQPIFVGEGLSTKVPLPGMPGVFRDTEESILQQMESDSKGGVEHFLLFLVPEKKSDDTLPSSFSSRVISSIKKEFPNSMLWMDTCLCSITTHGHCCLFDQHGKMNNKESVARLSQLALLYADAGADGIAPSDMMDGRVASHRSILDSHGHSTVPIMSYSTKFKSNFYGPFREAADSAPHFGDRSAYQIDVRNRDDALLSSRRDAEEGADLLMVKPGLTSIDLIREIGEMTGLPVGAYQVSGEYASLNYLAENGMCNFDDSLRETWYTFARSGARYLITYAARRGKEIL